MERALPLSCGLLWLGSALGQMVAPSGTSLHVDGGTSLRIDAPLTWNIEAGASVVNDGDIVLGSEAVVDEAFGAAITGAGTERTTRDLSTPVSSENPGGLGGIITTNATLGLTQIVRGHMPFTDYSGHMSIARWMDFTPTNNTSLNATLAFRYDPAELNGLAETEQRLHVRASTDIWSFLSSTVNTGTSTVTTSGLDSLGVFTTFDEELPSGIADATANASFALLGIPGEPRYLKVPAGTRAKTLEVFAVNGSRIARLSPNWSEGVHSLPEMELAGGVYHLRVNDRINFTFIQP